MNNNYLQKLCCLLALLSVSVPNAAPLHTMFTYQGNLSFNNVPANGSFDFRFTLHDTADAGSQVGDAALLEDTTVRDGGFTVELDFGAGPFAGDQLWLEIGVREGALSDPHEPLLPRQKLTATPYALYAEMVAIDAISSVEIVDNTIMQSDIASGAVGAAELANNAVDSAAIAAGAVATTDLADNAVTSAKVASDTLTAEDLAAGSVGSSEVIASQVQRRVSGACHAGTYLAGINEDGTVQCAVLPVGLARTLDSDGDVGSDTSVAIRADGRPIISYYDGTNGDLKVYDCADVACATGLSRTLDGGGTVGRHTSIAIRADLRPIISYYDSTNGDLRIYDCTNAACSSGTTRTLDGDDLGRPSDVGRHTSVAIRANGLPIIGYFDNTNDDLKIYDCADTACASGIDRTLDSGGFAGLYTSVAIRADGRPIIGHSSDANRDLRVYDCFDATCSSGTDRTLDSDGEVGSYTSVAIRFNGRPIISYYDKTNADLKVYDCADAACSSGIDRTLDSDGNVGGRHTSVAIRADGLPIIGYFDNTNDDLKIYDCADTGCTSGSDRTLDSGGAVGFHVSVAIRADGLPIISYSDATNDDLRVYSCGDARCEN